MISNGKKNRRINKKKVITTIIIMLVLVVAIGFSILYSQNVKFMNFCDEYIFRKNVTEDNLKTIEINNFKETNVYAYKEYILVLKDNVLTAYNKFGHDEYKLDIEISNPIFVVNGSYLCIAERDGQKIYMVSGQSIIWQKEIEGNISEIKINKNGYSAVLLFGTTDKTTVQIYNQNGVELFRRHLSKAIVIATDISDDNKCLAIAEINYEGIVIQSTVEIISIEAAKINPDEAIVHTYNAPADNLIVDIKYQSKNNLLCLYDTYIDYIDNNYQNKKILDFDEKIINADISMSSKILTLINIDKTNKINLTDPSSQESLVYEVNNNVAKIDISENTIAVHLGTEILFLNDDGWLLKRYTGDKEIKDIIFTNQIAGIIYKDKINIISL